jgi:prepilin-type N-terminal cleavage/methylation domain-containing protein
MTHPQIKRRQSGFTLIEIAIVLVIIGLLLGGILKGQELITQGRIRNVANDFQSMTAAINLYQDRYRAIPGDDIGAATRWAVTGTSTTSGDGDGVIGTASSSTFPAFNSGTAGDESRLFWHHLRLAGLVGGPTTTGALGTATPINAVSGVTGVQNIGFGIPGLVICSSNLPAKIAQAIDTQFDDGNAKTGTVRGAAAMSANAPAVDYVDDGTTFYIVCKAP